MEPEQLPITRTSKSQWVTYATLIEMVGAEKATRVWNEAETEKAFDETIQEMTVRIWSTED